MVAVDKPIDTFPPTTFMEGDDLFIIVRDPGGSNSTNTITNELLFGNVAVNATFNETATFEGNVFFNGPINSNSFIQAHMWDYNDLATMTIPLAVNSDVLTVITNDGLGPLTELGGANGFDIYDANTARFNFNQFALFATVDIRVDILITTTTPNQEVSIILRCGIGGTEFDVVWSHDHIFKNTGQHQFMKWSGIHLSNENIKDNDCEFRILTDSDASVIVNGWYIRVLHTSNT